MLTKKEYVNAEEDKHFPRRRMLWGTYRPHRYKTFTFHIGI
jgi:hypothetical protein